MFTPLHIFFILLTIVTVPLISNYVMSGGMNRVELWLKVLTIVIVFFDPIYWIWEYQYYGYFNWDTTLPLYLCSLFWILMPIAIFSKPSFVKQISLANIVSVGMISGILGFVLNFHLDTWGVISFVGLRSLLYHYLMIFGAWLIRVSGYYQPKAGDQWRAFIPVGIILIPGIILNILYGYDYGYTAGGQGTILTLVSDRMPIVLFLILMYGLWFILVWLLFYRKLPLFENHS